LERAEVGAVNAWSPISDVSKPRLVSRTKCEPSHRFDVHTVSPDMKRKLVYVNSEAVVYNCKGRSTM